MKMKTTIKNRNIFLRMKNSKNCKNCLFSKIKTHKKNQA